MSATARATVSEASFPSFAARSTRRAKMFASGAAKAFASSPVGCAHSPIANPVRRMNPIANNGVRSSAPAGLPPRLLVAAGLPRLVGSPAGTGLRGQRGGDSSPSNDRVAPYGRLRRRCLATHDVHHPSEGPRHRLLPGLRLQRLDGVQPGSGRRRGHCPRSPAGKKLLNGRPGGQGLRC